MCVCHVIVIFMSESFGKNFVFTGLLIRDNFLGRLLKELSSMTPIIGKRVIIIS